MDYSVTQEETMDNRLLATVPEACEALGIGRSKLYELMASQAIPVVRIGRAVRISRQALANFVAQLESDQRRG
jgi:excisionase family DNA binding protein